MLVSPSEFFATSVFDLRHVWPLLRLQIADCISLSILRMMMINNKGVRDRGVIQPLSDQSLLRFLTQEPLGVWTLVNCPRHLVRKDCQLHDQEHVHMLVLLQVWMKVWSFRVMNRVHVYIIDEISNNGENSGQFVNWFTGLVSIVAWPFVLYNEKAPRKVLL